MADFEQNDKPQGMPAGPTEPTNSSPYYDFNAPNTGANDTPQPTAYHLNPPETTSYYQYNEQPSSPTPPQNNLNNFNSNNNYAQPNYQNPNYQQPNYEQPNYQQPNYEQPNYQQPNYQQPNYEQPNYQQPNYEQPNYQQPNYEQPNYQNPNYGQTYYQNPNYEQTNSQQQIYQQNSPEFQNQSQNLSVEPIMKQKKKFPKKLVAILLILCLLIGAGAFACTKIPSLSNTFALTTMKPGGYYAKVEQANTEGGINALSKSYGKTLSLLNSSDKKGFAQDFDVKFSLGDNYSKMITSMDFKSIEAKYSSMMNSEKGKVGIELLANGTSLANINTLLDLTNSETYIQIPELASAYLKLDSSVFNTDASSFSSSAIASSASAETIQNMLSNPALSEKELNSILRKYSKVITSELGQVKDVKLSKNQTITANKMKQKATKVTINLSSRDLSKIVLSVLNKAKDDKDLIQLCEDADLCTADSYKSGIETQISSLKESESELTDEKIVEMTVWTNSEGLIIGRELTITGDSVINFGYSTAKKGSSTGIEAWISNDNEEMATFLGKTDSNGKKESGSFTLNLTAAATSSIPLSFKIDMEDYEIIPDREGTFNGVFNITCTSLPGFTLTLDAKGTEKSQKLSFKISDTNGEVATISTTLEDVEYKDFNLPSSSDKIYDIETQSQDYLAEADTDGFLSHLSTVLKIEDINTLINELVLGSSALGGNMVGVPDINLDPEVTPDPNAVATPDPNAVATPDPNAAATPDPNSSVGGQIEVDENGDYSYEPDYQTIKDAGIGSTGSAHYNLPGTQLKDSVTALIEQMYGSSLAYVDETMTNRVSGHQDATSESSYEYTYFENTATWSSTDNSSLYFCYVRDSVTDQPINFYLSEKDKTRGDQFILAALSLVEGEISEENKTLILQALTVPAGESYASYNYGTSLITISSYDDQSYSYFISAVQ